ncbi:S8 family serine peptidase [Geomonas sp.]|uniref:S8 family serine peptidase n=1 Tax=Geomonas sp. TaxID=2651584 RepID=UPI002B4A5CFF|nr:S8 family serine peptidase [Geomonas sp.]HJV36669.1 S8 family serine peptidase [Geomonas sp.]
MLQGKEVADGVPYLETGVLMDEADNLYVKISAEVTDELLQRLISAGVQVTASYPEYHSIDALVPPDLLERIAGWSDIRFISTQFKNQFNSAPKTEGDVTHKGDVARSSFSVNGSGVKVGVISNGVQSLASSQAAGALGPVTVLPGQTGTGDEGTAMLEIVHTLAPGASLYFATGGQTGTETIAQNIRALRQAGCDIIVDDLSNFVETPFQDGQAANVISPYNMGSVVQAVNDVVNDGALYFSSAGNFGSLDYFNSSYVSTTGSGTWEGDFADGGAAPAPLAGKGTVHVFNSNGSRSIGNKLTSNTDIVVLTWADPIGASSNDYDLYLLDPYGSQVVAKSNSTQNGSNDPVEGFMISGDITGYQVVIVKKSGGADRFLRVSTGYGHLQFSTSGATFGHNAADKAFSVAATPAHDAFYPWYPHGPFPDPFSLGDTVEPFSSDGPRRIFYNGDGSPITAGNFSSTGGRVLSKPDFTAADGVSVTGVGGFGSPFFGTSAAAPHAAAIAALVKSAAPGMTSASVRSALSHSVIPNGWNRNSGAGIVMAWEAVRYSLQTSYTMTGMVYSGMAGGPVVSGANVSIAGKTGTTEMSGYFTITGIPAGTYTLTISATGYATYTNSSYAVTADQNGLYFLLTPVPVANGVCGAANGGRFASAPTSNLCSAGTPSAVTGSGPWNWTCVGSSSGTTATCSANTMSSGNGICGTSNGVAFASAPGSNLCASGTPSAVTGSGPWNWTCSGTGGTNATCSSPVVDVTFDLANVTAIAGKEVSIPVTLTRKATSKPSTLLVDFHYDANLLTSPTAVIGAAGTAAGKNLFYITPSAGVFRISEYDRDYTPFDNGVVATLTFTVPPTVPSGTVITLMTAPSASDLGVGLTVAGRNATITVTSPDVAPTLAVSTLPNGAVTSSGTLNITGTVTSANGIRSVTVNGTGVSVAADGSFSTAITLAEGPNTIAVEATDNLGSTSTDTRTIILDTAAPAVSLSVPADNSVTAQPLLTVTGSVSDANIASVSAAVGDSAPLAATLIGNSFTVTVTLAQGSNNVVIVATDRAGNSSTTKRTVTLDTTRPQLAVTDPNQDITTYDSSYLLKGTVTDDTTALVTITVDGTTYRPAVAADGSFQQQIAFSAEKTYAIVVVATDGPGNSATVQRNIIYKRAGTGDLNGDGTVNLADALAALQIAIGRHTATPEQLQRGDVAPLVSGTPHPDGVIDAGDALLILEKVVNLITW